MLIALPDSACACAYNSWPQALQREREGLERQLRASGSAQLEKMASEVAQLRAAAAEAVVMREQVGA